MKKINAAKIFSALFGERGGYIVKGVLIFIAVIGQMMNGHLEEIKESNSELVDQYGEMSIRLQKVEKEIDSLKKVTWKSY